MAEFSTFDKVAEQPVLLLSQRPYIPYGDVTLVYGEGSLGKGRSVASVIASVTRGQPVGLDSDGDEPGDVVVMLPEDKPGEQVVGRLLAAGADLTRVHDLTRIEGGARFKFSASSKKAGHLPFLRAYVSMLRRACMCGQVFTTLSEAQSHAAEGVPGHSLRNPRLVVGDPITALVGDGTLQTNAGARAFLEPVQDMADQTGVAVILVAHPTKAGVLQGSGAIRDAARVVLRMRRDEVNSDHRLVEVEKGNNVPPELLAPVKFTILQRADGRPYVQWLGAASLDEPEADWRAVRSLEKTARQEAQAKAAVAAVSLPSAPVSGPWRVLRWDRVPGGTDVPSIVGDTATDGDARWLAESAAGRVLRWVPFSKGTGWVTSPSLKSPDGTITAFAFYEQQDSPSLAAVS